MSLNEYNNLPKQPKKGITISPRIGGGIIIGLVLLVGGFFVGVAYQKGKTPTTKVSQTASTQQGTRQSTDRSGFGGGFQRGSRAIGTVSAVSSSSITITTRQGTSSTYTITSNTTITNNGSSASISDIQTGGTVFITLDSSNPQDASSIALNPSFGGGMGGNGSNDGSGNSTDSAGTNTDTNAIST